jgi:hypothetical protein
MTPPGVANEATSSKRDNNPANNNGTQTTSPKNVLLRVERTLSRIGKNRTRVDSGEHHKAPYLQARHSGAGAVAFHFWIRCEGNMANEGLRDLYIDELKDLYNA